MSRVKPMAGGAGSSIDKGEMTTKPLANGCTPVHSIKKGAFSAFALWISINFINKNYYNLCVLAIIFVYPRTDFAPSVAADKRASLNDLAWHRQEAIGLCGL
jgi:hypothetical protein